MMLKKWIAGLLSACIAAGNVTAGASSLAAVNYFAASAEESVDAANENTDDSTLGGEVQEGQTKDGITYIYNNEKVVVNGYVGESPELVIPEEINGLPVTDIAEKAFEFSFDEKVSIEKVVIEAHISKIPDGCFSRCPSLTELTMPDSVVSIGAYTFEDCTSLQKVVMSENLLSIGKFCFWGCYALNEISIPDSVTTIAYGAFCSCQSLKEIEIPNSLNVLEDSVFGGCSLEKITIPDNLTSIGAYCFSGCTSLKEIIIPDCVTAIDNSTFENCSSLLTIYGVKGSYAETYANENDILFAEIGEHLEFDLFNTDNGIVYMINENDEVSIVDYKGFELTLDIPETIEDKKVVKILKSAFADCTSLKEVTIPNSVTTIGKSAFQNCNELEKITVPNSVVSVGDGCFYDCSSLTEIEMSESITSIAKNCFTGCSLLDKFTIPKGVVSIGDCAFSSCKLSDLTIPENVEFIGDGAFSGCTFSEVLVPESVKIFGDSAFSGCDFLEKITISDGITSIGKHAFYYDGKLKEITIPESITSIGEAAFSNCYSLEKIVIPDGVTSIDDQTFYRCSSLKELTIPSSVTSISESAFEECNSALIVYGAKDSYAEKYAQENHLIFSEIGNHIDVYTSDSGFVYMTNTNDEIVILKYKGEDTILSIPEEIDDKKVVEIFANAFICNYSLKEVVIPDGVSSIGEGCFSYCNVLEKITIPNSVVSIGDYCFYECESLKEISLHSVTSIGKQCFYSCISLEQITLPNSVTAIGDSAFENCARLTEITIPDSVESIGNRAFCFCSSLTKATIPDSITTIGDDVFSSTPLNEIIIPDSVTLIGHGTFYTCNWLKNATISDSVTSIGYEAFYECTSLEKVTLSKNLKSIEKKTFEGCKSLKSITIPETLTTISDASFRNCEKMTYAYIPETVTSIADNAFENCYFLVINAPKGSYAIDYAKEHGIKYVEIEYTDENGSFEGKIDNDVIDKIKGDQELPVISDKVSAIFDIGATIEISHRHGNKKITFGYQVVNKVDNEEQQDTVDSVLENGGKLVDFSLVDADGNMIAFGASENGGTVTITVPYTAPVSANKVTVYYISPDGSRTDMNGVYDPSTKTITFTTTHFSLFSIEEVLDDSQLTKPAVTTTVVQTTTSAVTKLTTATTSSTTTKTTTATTSSTTAKPTTATTSATTTKQTTATTSSATTTQITVTTSITTAGSITTSISTSVTNIADDDLCSWAINDYQKKTGIMAAAATIAARSEGAYEITLTDENGDVLDVYTVDPKTGVGTDSSDTEVNLPQTGNNAMTNRLICIGAVLLIGFGFLAVKASGTSKRKKGETAED